MSVRIESSFPESINTYYNNNTYRKTVDTLYHMIESGEFSAEQLHAAVELAETKEIIYGHRRMPTCKIEPMPGDKAKEEYRTWFDRTMDDIRRRLEGTSSVTITRATPMNLDGYGDARCGPKAIRIVADWPANHRKEPNPVKTTAVCDWCAHPIYFVNGKWTHRDDRLDNLSAHTPTPR